MGRRVTTPAHSAGPGKGQRRSILTAPHTTHTYTDHPLFRHNRCLLSCCHHLRAHAVDANCGGTRDTHAQNSGARVAQSKLPAQLLSKNLQAAQHHYRWYSLSTLSSVSYRKWRLRCVGIFLVPDRSFHLYG